MWSKKVVDFIEKTDMPIQVSDLYRQLGATEKKDQSCVRVTLARLKKDGFIQALASKNKRDGWYKKSTPEHIEYKQMSIIKISNPNISIRCPHCKWIIDIKRELMAVL